MAKTDTTRRRKIKKRAAVAEDDTVNEEQAEAEEGDEQDPQMRSAIEVKRKIPTVNVSWEIEESSDEATDRMASPANGKRKPDPAADSFPSKKTRLINDGYCLYVGNLNSSKTSEEIKDELAKFFIAHSLLFQDIRVDRARKHAFVDVISEMDFTKTLTLNGEMIFDKPMKIARAKVKSDSKEKVMDPELKKKVKDSRCLFLKNIPYDATKQDILKVFSKAVTVRFPGGAKSPNQGMAFVEFKNEGIAMKMLKQKGKVKIQDRDLIVDRVKRDVPKVSADSNRTQAPAPNNFLFVGRLPKNVTERHLKKVFKKAVGIIISPLQDKLTRNAFVEFATVADAEKVLQSSKDIKICKQRAKVEMCRRRMKPETTEVSSKSLFVVGLTATTTAETLQSAFEGAISARVAVHKDTGVSKRFGFVDFNSEESCKAAKDAMEDCEIDGSKVTVDYAIFKGDKGHQGDGVSSVGSVSG